MRKPKLLITMGDVAGIGPEIIARGWDRLGIVCEPVVVGDPTRLPAGVRCINPSSADLTGVETGRVSADAGRAAYDWLCYAIDECVKGRADGIVTCPLHKEGLRLAGVSHPGHTEILAERCGVREHAMLLYDDELRLAVAHVTLHVSIRSALERITPASILEKIRLLQAIVPRLTGQTARIAVAALNPHASDGGLFGDEEATSVRPAVLAAVKEGIVVDGPIPADAIFLPPHRSQRNGIVCLLHDHGHIAMKLLGGRRAVNVTAGLPIVRTSVAHGTAYDIAGQGIADESSLIAAVHVAARLASHGR
jgi:4-hydroxythreonine-4-phosphate dehydrogenase